MMESKPFKVFIASFSLLIGLTSQGSPASPETPSDRSLRETEQWLKAMKVKATLFSERLKDGSIQKVRVTLPVDSPLKDKIQVQYIDKEIPLFPRVIGKKNKRMQYVGIIGIPYQQEPGESFVDVQFGSRADAKYISLPFEVVSAKYKSENLRVDPDKVEPPKRVQARIKREGRAIGRIYRNVIYRRYWKGGFKLPVHSRVTSVFGIRRFYNGIQRGFHRGVDLRAPTGTPIRAPAGGIIAMARDLYFTGNTVIMNHGYGIVTIFAHMSKLKVKRGQVVKRGHLLGLAGATGRVNGPHLHYGAVINRVKVDPMLLSRVLRK